MNFDITNSSNILVVGAGHGIGLGLVKVILEKYSNITIYATYRLKNRAIELFELKELFKENLNIIEIDPTNESEIKKLSQELELKKINLDLIINSVGLLHSEMISPEKSIKDFDPSVFLELMTVNCLVTPLLAKHLVKLIVTTQMGCFISISAKIGSIEDNRIGGWHSYRASKAALNMLIKNIAIEFKRRKINCLVLAIHPGTTKTNLSKPFISKTSYTVHEPIDCAQNILNVINKKNESHSGRFYSWNGDEIPW